MNSLKNKETTVYDSKLNEYDVSVCIISYNIGKYISASINSILEQETTCTYEIVIGDNASTDCTRQIELDYWVKNPDKFCLLFNKENLGLCTNMYNTLCKTKGKYVIILYGDDYWIDKYKLQRQFDFLEKQSQYIGVTTPIEFRYDGENTAFRTIPKKFLRNEDITLEKYLAGYDFPMAGLMFRNALFTNNLQHFHKMIEASKFIDDLSFCILFLMKGQVYILPEVTAVYRCFKKNHKANNFNSVNSMFQRSIKSIDLCNKLVDLTNDTLDLSTRYGLILASAFFAKMKHDLSSAEYHDLENLVAKKYKNKRKKLLIKGMVRKIELRFRP